MKKYKTKFWSRNVPKAILTGQYALKSELVSDVRLEDGVLEVCLDTEVGTPDQCWLFLYDRKDSLFKSAFLEASEYNDRTFRFALDDGFLDSMRKADAIQQGRLCLALRWGRQFSCFFLKCPDRAGARLALQGDLSVFFSKGGLLSAKLVDETRYMRMCGAAKVRTIRREDCRVSMTLFLSQYDQDDIQFQLVSQTTRRPARGVTLTVGPEKEEDKGIEVAVVLDFGHVTEWDFDAYDLIRTYRGVNIKAELSEDVRDESGVLSEIAHIRSGCGFDLCVRTNDSRQLDMQIAQKVYPYMISVITAVYNVGGFLNEAVDSVLAQDLSQLEKFIIGKKSSQGRKRVYEAAWELILVDDGSTDGSGAICDEYAARYDQIRVIHKPNGGVSSARNAGISAAKGKYLNFMDADDRFSENVMEQCFLSLERWQDRTDVVCFPIRYFDAKTGDHVLNVKFEKGSRIIDLWREPNNHLFVVHAAMFRASSVKDKIWFDEKMHMGEDVKFVYSLLLSGQARFGVVSDCTYWYRKRRSGEDSALDSARKKKEYYTYFLTDGIDFIKESAQKKYGFLPRYIQYALAYQMQWRISGDRNAAVAKTVLGDGGLAAYRERVMREFCDIDSDIILAQTNILAEQKRYILAYKLGREPDRISDGTDIIYTCEGRRISSVAWNNVALEVLNIDGGQLFLEGYAISFERNASFFLGVNGRDFIPLEPVRRAKNVFALGETICLGTAFRCRVPLDLSVPECALGFYERVDGQYIRKQSILCRKLMPLSNTFTRSYYRRDGWFVRMENSELWVRHESYIGPHGQAALNSYEAALLRQAEAKVQELEEQGREIAESPERDELAEQAKAWRSALELRREMVPALEERRRTPHKKLWLVSDRTNVAGDNGEALFLYLTRKDDPEVEVWFAVSGDCPDYERLRQVGNVVARNSREYLKLHLMADCIISAHADEYVINPFYLDGTTDVFRDLLADKPFVFLQHGVIKDDLSGWLNRYNKNIRGFVTAAGPEYRSILECKYYYSEREVWLTGLPRHDRLYRDEKNYITIMPTWRKYLEGAFDRNHGIFTLRGDFPDSSFFIFYNGLLNDKRLLEAAEKYGYTVCFKPHPNLTTGLGQFDHDSRVLFIKDEKTYREIFAESNLIITDYSSTVMDFAYLRKPVAYCQFDREEFFAGHSYTEGYFDYERDGFGEVTYDLDSLVDVMIDYMKNGCPLKPMYRERMDGFFAFNDQNNCERVYQKLKEL